MTPWQLITEHGLICGFEEMNINRSLLLIFSKTFGGKMFIILGFLLKVFLQST